MICFLSIFRRASSFPATGLTQYPRPSMSSGTSNGGSPMTIRKGIDKADSNLSRQSEHFLSTSATTAKGAKKRAFTGSFCVPCWQMTSVANRTFSSRGYCKRALKSGQTHSSPNSSQPSHGRNSFNFFPASFLLIYHCNT